MMKGLHVHGVSHAFDGHTVLDNVSLTIPAGELVCLLGPSGSGKSTLLRIAAGLERLQQGRVIIDERVVAGSGTHVPPEDRGVGLMFQDYALFPHLTVLDNVTFGLSHQPRRQARKWAIEMLKQVGMDGHAGKHPHMLSGGQQQRVALARALAPEPQLVLLDEPFSGLDKGMRAKIREDTLSVLKQSGIATMMVTHDPEEAMFMADRIKVLSHDGRILQAGRPADIYYQPVDEYVAMLFGHMNLIHGVVSEGAVDSPMGRIAVDGIDEGRAVKVLIRPEGFVLTNGVDGGVGTPVEVISTHLLGHSSIVRLRVREGKNMGAEFQVRVPGSFDAAEKGRLSARIDAHHAFVYPEG